MKRHQPSEELAIRAAHAAAERLGITKSIELGAVLGTGWGDAVEFEDAREMSFNALPGFEGLGDLPGHARSLVAAKVGSKDVLVLRGRVHVNEAPADPAVYQMVRLQSELLFQLGVRRYIVTCAAGSLDSSISVGELIAIESLVTLFAPDMPLFAGEFCSPEDTIVDACNDFVHSAAEKAELTSSFGAYAMVRGPFFEGRHRDKQILESVGADIVGMSVLPELCIAALYGVKTIPVAFVTNTAAEEHSHAENVRRMQEAAPKLGAFITHLVSFL